MIFLRKRGTRCRRLEMTSRASSRRKRPASSKNGGPSKVAREPTCIGWASLSRCRNDASSPVSRSYSTVSSSVPRCPPWRLRVNAEARQGLGRLREHGRHGGDQVGRAGDAVSVAGHVDPQAAVDQVEVAEAGEGLGALDVDALVVEGVVAVPIGERLTEVPGGARRDRRRLEAVDGALVAALGVGGQALVEPGVAALVVADE